eukprot:350371-Chlamydomonas_euryale.AAC.9
MVVPGAGVWLSGLRAGATRACQHPEPRKRVGKGLEMGLVDGSTSLKASHAARANSRSQRV